MADEYTSPFDRGELPQWSAGHVHVWEPYPDRDWFRCRTCEQLLPAFLLVVKDG